jgi:hypothetical protein
MSWLSRAAGFDTQRALLNHRRPYRNQRFRVSIRRKTIGYSTLEFDYHHGDTENTEKFIKSSVNSVAPWFDFEFWQELCTFQH